MSPVKVSKVEVRESKERGSDGHKRRQLVGQLLPPGGTFTSNTTFVSVSMSTGWRHRLVIADNGWQFRFDRSPEAPSFLKMPTDDWRRMWSLVDSREATLDVRVSLKSPDLQDAKQLGDNTIALDDAVRISVNLRRKTLNLDEVGIFGRHYDSVYVGTVESISMTSS